MTTDYPAGHLGSILRELRVRRGLTGKQLAGLAGMSQPKISRIENGVGGPPSPDDVALLARVLEAGDEQTRQMVAEAHELQEPIADWEIGAVDLELRQTGIGRLETTATDIKTFNPICVVGLLQTSGYAEAMLTDARRLISPELEGPAVRAATARIHRQRVLDDPGKRFDFVMAEASLSNRLCPPEEMPAQLRRIRELARRPNIAVSFIPADARWTQPPIHNFTILDNRHVIVDLYGTALAKHDESEATLYGNVFAEMKNIADADIDQILERYRDKYVRELANRR
jgi:transcriptional regulator with XRE-family HTH domain